MAKYLGYLIIAVSIVFYLFFTYYEGDLVASPFLWQILAGIVFLTGIGLIAYSEVKKEDEAEEQQNLAIENFIRTAKKLPIALADCELKHHFYREEVEQRSEEEVLFSMAIGEAPLGSHQEVHTCVLVYTDHSLGRERKFVSPIIYMDETSVRLKIYQQKQTNIYIHPSNENLYYFELSFLIQ